jgi:hypothetical protein
MDAATRSTAGAALITIVFIEYGGLFLYRSFGKSFTDFQQRFFRAGHAHAGVLVILGLVSLVLVGSTELTGFWRWFGSTGALVAAILMPAGFFFGAAGRQRTTPNRWIVLLFAGAGVLGAAVLTLGVGLLAA